MKQRLGIVMTAHRTALRSFVLCSALLSILLVATGIAGEPLATKPTTVSVRTQNYALQGLLQRVLGKGLLPITLKVDTSLKLTFGDKDGFRIRGHHFEAVISGTTAYAAANGLNYYLRKVTGGQFSWSGKQIPWPLVVPLPDTTIDVPLPDKVRYYENACTASYSSVWWDWPRWQREIDWMAMNGINYPLAPVGQEFVSAETFKAFGLKDTDLDTFFTGPAFLAWNRMGNLRGFGGPLPKSWIAKQKLLQKSILQRMREFGMTPVVPGFNGFVPRAFERLYPRVKFSRAPRWNNFDDENASPTILPATEAFFMNVSSSYISTYSSIYESDHLYSIDLFNEVTPTATAVGELAAISSRVHQSLRIADPDAVWVMQGWMFHADRQFWTESRVKEFITAPPRGELLILDLFSEQFPQFSRFSNYYGVPFVWCMLHNFGGVNGLFGNFEWINEEPLRVRERLPNMVGFGITAEGTVLISTDSDSLGQNEVIYEFMAENSYRTTPVDVSQWLKTYVKHRYGISCGIVQSAWERLHRTVYNVTDKNIINHGKYILTQRPTLHAKPFIWYDGTEIVEAVAEFVLASYIHDELCHKALFHHDFVDVARQGLQVKISEEYLQMMVHFQRKDLIEFRRHARRLLKCINVLNEVLATDDQFLLGAWIKGARMSAGPYRTVQQRFEFNAKNQITSLRLNLRLIRRWGPKGEIIDYASKMWAGVVEHYYGNRWKTFIRLLTNSLRLRTPIDEEYLRLAIINEAEIPFVQKRRRYQAQPKGNVCNFRPDIMNALLPDGPAISFLKQWNVYL